MLESDLQRAIIMWASTMERQHPELAWLWHCPNGGKRDAKEATGMKAQGVRAGVVDLHLDVPRGGFHGLKIELKKPGCKCPNPSPEQVKYLDFVKSQGYDTLVSNNFEECKAKILAYMNG
jgi:hypothetical protein